MQFVPTSTIIVVREIEYNTEAQPIWDEGWALLRDAVEQHNRANIKIALELLEIGDALASVQYKLHRFQQHGASAKQ